MSAPTRPQYPVYIPSKSRATIATTPKALDKLGVPYRLIVEQHQLDEYADVYGHDRLLVLPQSFVDEYDTCDDRGDELPKGPGPARNFAWQHSIEQGHDWHWVIDDNIKYWGRLYDNTRRIVGDGLIFAAMEDFASRYANVGMAGPDYWFFVKARTPQRHPYVLNRRIYSCNLIRNDVELRWRGRWNEDLILSLDMVKASWATICFRTFLQFKIRTQVMAGGNTEAFYSSLGTLPKSQMAVREHPDCVRLQYRFGRWHHWADWSQFEQLQLVRRDDYQVPADNPYRTQLVDRPATQGG